jgi:hypothetical protein
VLARAQAVKRHFKNGRHAVTGARSHYGIICSYGMGAVFCWPIFSVRLLRSCRCADEVLITL